MQVQWVCNNCGNTDRFEGVREVKKWTEQVVLFFGEDEEEIEEDIS